MRVHKHLLLAVAAFPCACGHAPPVETNPRVDAPALVLDGDHADARYYSEAQVKNRVDAFLEALESKKLAQQREG